MVVRLATDRATVEQLAAAEREVEGRDGGAQLDGRHPGALGALERAGCVARTRERRRDERATCFPTGHRILRAGTYGGKCREPHTAQDGVRNLQRRSMNMNHRVGSCLGVAVSAVVLMLLLAPAPGYSQTEGMEKRGEARDTRQTGRDAARDAKDACKENDSRAECRQQKRDTKQDVREQARDGKNGD
jgi:hypothetical protein